MSPEAQTASEAAVEAGVLKIMSKMGISTVDSYRGAQTFEVLGLGPEVVDVCFTGTPSTVGGIGWHDLGVDVLARHADAAWPDPTALAADADLDAIERDPDDDDRDDPTDTDVRAARGHANAPRRRATHRGHQPRPADDGPGRPVPGRFVPTG